MDETIDLKAGMASWKVLVLTLAGFSVVLDHFVVRGLIGTLRIDHHHCVTGKNPVT